MEHHAAVPLPWEVDPAVRGHHERGGVQGKSVAYLLYRTYCNTHYQP